MIKDIPPPSGQEDEMLAHHSKSISRLFSIFSMFFSTPYNLFVLFYNHSKNVQIQSGVAYLNKTNSKMLLQFGRGHPIVPLYGTVTYPFLTLFLAIVFLQLSMFTNHLTNIISFLLQLPYGQEGCGGRPRRKLYFHIWLVGEMCNWIDFYEIWRHARWTRRDGRCGKTPVKHSLTFAKLCVLTLITELRTLFPLSRIVSYWITWKQTPKWRLCVCVCVCVVGFLQKWEIPRATDWTCVLQCPVCAEAEQ